MVITKMQKKLILQRESKIQKIRSETDSSINMFIVIAFVLGSSPSSAVQAAVIATFRDLRL